MTRSRAASVVLLALALAGCNSGQVMNDWGTAGDQKTLPGERPTGVPTDWVVGDQADPGDPLDSLVLGAGDLPGGGWEQMPPSDGVMGGSRNKPDAACLFDFSTSLTLEELFTESGRDFIQPDNGLITSDFVWSVTSAEQVASQISAQLDGCTGPYEATDSEGTFTMSSSSSDAVLPALPVSVCRSFEMRWDASVITGTMCIGASGGTLLEVMLGGRNGALFPAADQAAILAAASARAFPPAG